MTFSDVYQQHSAAIHRYCLVVLKDASVAEDVAAQALVQAFAAFEQARPSDEYVRLWLLRIARNACLDHLRERSRLRRMLQRLALEQSPEPNPEGIAITNIQVTALLAALPALRPRDRELIALRCAADLSYREMGKVLGLSENAATVATHRAIERLRHRLEIGHER